MSLPPQIRLSLFTTPVILNQPFGFAEDVVFTAPLEMYSFYFIIIKRKKLKKWFGWQKYLQLTFHSEATIWKEKQGQCKKVPYGLAHLQSSNGFKIWHFKIYGFLCYLLPFFTLVKLLEISPGYQQLIRQKMTWHHVNVCTCTRGPTIQTSQGASVHPNKLHLVLSFLIKRNHKLHLTYQRVTMYVLRYQLCRTRYSRWRINIIVNKRRWCVPPH